MEHAVAEERKRAKLMEEQEKDLSADELRTILKEERHRMATFARTIAELRSTATQCQSEAEIHEEARINSLLGRLERMQLEKGRLVNELEREEEMMTNTLQRKLDQVKQEKLKLQHELEREHNQFMDLQRANQQQNGTTISTSTATPVEDGLPPIGLGSLEEGAESEEEAGVDLPDLAGISV
jgi:hypothetical protein